MGEYAKYKGVSVKIGTCEDMYYLRADQARLVTPESSSVDPVKYAKELRFRFPFPSEDGIEPGAFDDHAFGLRVFGATVPEGVEHHAVQFRAENGYLCMLPCPESSSYVESPGLGAYSRRLVDSPAIGVALNGYGGAVEITQQRVWGDDQLVTVCDCKGCGVKYRLETIDMAQSVIDGLTAMAAEQQRTGERNNTPGNIDVARRYVEIARRIVAGFTPGAASQTIGTRAPRVPLPGHAHAARFNTH